MRASGRTVGPVAEASDDSDGQVRIPPSLSAVRVWVGIGPKSMVVKVEQIVRYLVGIATIVVAAFMSVFYYGWLSGGADGSPPQPLLLYQSITIVIGLPLIGTGIALIMHRYRLTLILAVFTSGIYAVVTTFFNNIVMGVDIRYGTLLFATYTPTIFLSFFIFLGVLVVMTARILDG